METFIFYDNNDDNYDIDYFIELCKRNISKYNIIEDIKKNLINGIFSELIYNIVFENKQDLLVFTDIITYQITTTNNQKNNVYNNISIINLTECENELRNHYNIRNNENLLIFKYDFFLKNI